MRVNHATVARRVASLETLLGRPLFERRPDGYALTAQGRAVLDEAGAMDAAALSVLRRLDASGTSVGTGAPDRRPHALRRLPDRPAWPVSRTRPAVDLELIGEARKFTSLARREADIALRFGTLKDST